MTRLINIPFSGIHGSPVSDRMNFRSGIMNGDIPTPITFL